MGAKSFSFAGTKGLIVLVQPKQEQQEGLIGFSMTLFFLMYILDPFPSWAPIDKGLRWAN